MGTSTATVKDGVMPRKNILTNRRFMLLWWGQIISVIGNYVFDTTLVLWVVSQIVPGRSWTPLAASGIFMATLIPVLAIGPFVGVFVDRWVRRRTMMRMDMLRAILVALLLPLTGVWGGHFSLLWQLGCIYGVVFLTSMCSQVFNSAILAFTAEIVDESQLGQATGLTQMMASLAMISGPSLATLLFFTLGVQWAIVINALSFLCSFLLVRAISPVVLAPVEKTSLSLWQDFVEGLRFFVSDRILLTLLIAGVLVMMYEGTSTVLNVFFVTQNLHAPLAFFGFLGTAIGVGLIAGSLLATLACQRWGATRVLYGSLLLCGLLIMLYARLTSFIPALVTMALLGCTVGGCNMAAGPLLFRVTPVRLIGRITSVLTPLFSLASLLAITIAGSLASTVLTHLHSSVFGMTLGPIDTIFTAAGILVLCGGIWAFFMLRGRASIMKDTPQNH